RERRYRGMQDRSLRRHGVGGGARGRGDDDAVGAQGVDELAVERQAELDEARLGAFAEHRLVERERAQDRFALAPYLRVEQRALLERVLAVEDRADAVEHVLV